MEIFSKEIYTLVIPIKPEKDQPYGYEPGPCVGKYGIHKKHLDDNGKVFWSWHLKNAGIKKPLKRNFPELIKKLGEFQNIDGKMIKINDYGFFYSSENKSIRWKFRASTIKTTDEINEKEIEYIPEFRKVHYHPNSTVSWLLIEELEELDEPVKGKKIRNSYAYKFPDLYFYSNPNNAKEVFNTNHLTSGNAFLIEECL